MPAAEWARRQALSRRNVRRANLTVAAALGTVLVLAFGAVWQSHRAVRLQALAEAAQNEARQELRRALLAEARATRQSPRLDRREAALEIIRRAAALGPAPELRDDAVATLALPEYRLESFIHLTDTAQRYAFDHDIRRCALVMTNGDILIRRFADGEVALLLGRHQEALPEIQGPPVLVEFSPDGRTLAARHAGGALAVWDLTLGRLRFVHDGDSFHRLASGARFSSDSRHLVAPVFEPDGFAVLDVDSGRTMAHFPQISSFRHAAMRPGHTQFAADLGPKVGLFDWSDGTLVAEFPFPAGSRTLAWSADGAQLAIAGNTLEVEVWDLATHQARRLPGHQDDIYDCLFDASGTRLATSSLDGSSRLWDLRDGRLLASAMDRRLVALGPGGRSGWSVLGDRLEVRLEPRSTVLDRLAGPPGESDGLTFDLTPDARWAWSRNQHGRIWQWDLTRSSAPTLTSLREVDSLTVDPDGPRVLLAREGVLVSCDLLPSPDDQTPSTLTLSEPRPVRGAAHHRANLVASAAQGSVRAYVHLGAGAVWVDHGIPGQVPVRIEGAIHSSVDRRSGSARGTATIALSPDGQWLVCGADGIGGTRVFDTRTGKPKARLSDAVGGVQFSPDGQWLILAAVQACELFHTADWQRAWSQPAAVRHPNYSAVAACSPDGAWVAYAASTRHLALLDAPTGRLLAALEAPGTSPVVALRWSADGQRLVGFTRENAVEVWYPAGLREGLRTLGLAWENRPPENGGAAPPLTEPAPGFPFRVGVGVLGTAGLVAGIALASLRRHRRLIEDYAVSEERAARRERELVLEREVGQLKSSFVTMVSHEFRTPLGVTMSAVELLRNYLDRLTPAKKTELLDDIYRATLRMSGLMEQVLLLGWAESGRLGCRIAPLDLPDLVARLLDESQSASDRRCRLRFHADHPMDGAQGDEALLRHILSNLIANAVKYSPAGEEVALSARREGNKAVLTVSDRGIGIPAADQARLFQAFHRGSNVGQTPGTGLGLLIVKRCADLHGGSVHCQSVEGQGTTFTVRVPLFEAADTVAASAAPPTQHPTTASPRAKDAPPAPSSPTTGEGSPPQA